MKEIIFSVIRRAFIEAKYVQKAFLRPLPLVNQMRSSTRTIKRWAVTKNSTSNDTDDRQLVSK